MKTHNRGVEKAQGYLFVCIDADDWLIDTAVEQIINDEKNIIDSQVAGMMYLNYDGNKDEIVGSKFPWEEKEQVFSATATPKLAQYMLIETFEDRVTFMFRNTGTYEGFSVNDIPSPYTVYLK